MLTMLVGEEVVEVEAQKSLYLMLVVGEVGEEEVQRNWCLVKVEMVALKGFLMEVHLSLGWVDFNFYLSIVC